MAAVVDRLLAQLSGQPAEPRNRWSPTRNGGRDRASVPAAASTVVGSARDEQAIAAGPGAMVAFWARVCLALVLGVVMTQWPYAHECGVALLGYGGAVATVILAGSWVALASWRRRNASAHVLALLLTFWGIVLAAEQLLPRIGYAAEPAAWQCDGRGLFD
jgi:hypothetical protein